MDERGANARRVVVAVWFVLAPSFDGAFGCFFLAFLPLFFFGLLLAHMRFVFSGMSGRFSVRPFARLELTGPIQFGFVLLAKRFDRVGFYAHGLR